DVVGLDHIRPAGFFGGDELGEVYRAGAHGGQAQLGQLVASFGACQRFLHNILQLGDDLRRRAGGQEETVPLGDVEIGDARLGDGRHVRQLGHAPGRGDGQRLELAARHVVQAGGGVGEIHVDLAAHDVDD